MKRLFSTVGTLAVLAATPALAADFGAWDTDSDRFVDRTEFSEGFAETDVFGEYDENDDDMLQAGELIGASYAAMDLDGDGEVAVSEWDTWVDARTGERSVNLSVAEWDEDGNDLISRAEFDEEIGNTDWFADYDMNQDAAYSQEEFETSLFEGADIDDDDRLAEDEFLLDNFGV